MVVFLTIDDSAKELVPRLICNSACNQMILNNDYDLFTKTDINKIAIPFKYKDTYEYDPLMAYREQAYRKMIGWAKDDRIVVVDSEDGKSLDFLSVLIKNYADKHPTRHLFIVVDNFHLLNVPSFSGESRQMYKHLSHEVKALAVRHNCTILSTAEYRKINGENKPSNADLAESGSLEYDANCIAHLYNDLHIKRDRSKLFHTMPNDDQKRPLLESYFGKNKISSFKGTMYIKAYPDKAFFEEIPKSVWDSYIMANGTPDREEDPANVFEID